MKRTLLWATSCALLAGSSAGCEAPRVSVDVTGGAGVCSVDLAGLQGSLAMLEELGPPVVSALDLASGTSEVLYSVPSGGFAYEMDVHGQELLLAYTPPPSKAVESYDRSVLATLEGGGLSMSAVGGSDAWEFYPAYAADGSSAWFVATGEGTEADSMLSHRDLLTGETVGVIPDATEPAVSPSDDRIAWVAVNPETAQRSLWVGDADGGSPEVRVGQDDVWDLGLPFFSADGAWLYFVVLAGSAEEDPGTSLLDLLVPSAQAHSNHDTVGDWWRVPADGGAIEQVTALGTVLYDGIASPDGGLITATRNGVVRVAPDGEVQVVSCSRAVRALGLREGAAPAR